MEVDEGAVEFDESVVVVVLRLAPVLVEVGLPSSEVPSRSRLSNETGRWRGSMSDEWLTMESADVCLLSCGIGGEEMDRAGGRRGERTGRIGGFGPPLLVIATRVE